MKIKILLCAFCFILSATAAEVETERAALRVIQAAYEEACKTGDPERLAPYVTTNTTGIMVTGEEVAGMDGLKAYWAKIQSLMGPGGAYSVAIKLDHTDIFGDTSVSRGTTDDTVRIAGGHEIQFNTHWTAVCRKENGAWKILRMQASLDPVNNPFVAARVASAKLIYSVGGVVSGLVLGFVFFRGKKTRVGKAGPG